MKDFVKAMCILAVIVGTMYGALLMLRHFYQRTYITVEED